MDVRLKNVMGMVGATAVTGLAACMLLQSARARRTALAGVQPPQAGAGASRASAGRDGAARSAGERRTCAPSTHVAQRSRMGAPARLLILAVTLFHAFFRVNWLKFIGSPGMVSVFALIPAAWLLIRETFLVARRDHGATAERRARARRQAAGAQLQPSAG